MKKKVSIISSEAHSLADKLREAGFSSISVNGDEVNLLCPFHAERTPSFFANPFKGAKCFGCSLKFNSIKNLFEAINNKYNTNLDFIEPPESLFSFLDHVEVKPQTLNPDIISYYIEDTFYFEEHWGISSEVCKRRRLVIDPHTRAECFPIFDLEGNFWGFVERYPSIPRSRYIYPYGFKKSNHLLGAEDIGGDVWVVEGVRDLCAIETKLDVPAVALGGCDPSNQQIYLLNRYDSITLCLDNDRAGMKGTKKLLEKLPTYKLNVARYRGKDPVEGFSFSSRTFLDQPLFS